MAASGPKDDGTDLDGGGGIFAEINITPLTDIFLVLLIIFMVTTTAMNAESGAGQSGGLHVSLPKGGKADALQTPHDLSVAVLQDGRVVVGGKVVDEAVLKDLFAQAFTKNAETLVLVQADEGVQHGKVVQVMELARGQGLLKLAIATKAEE
jgi:biopolymer transport protein ExbD